MGKHTYNFSNHEDARKLLQNFQEEFAECLQQALYNGFEFAKELCLSLNNPGLILIGGCELIHDGLDYKTVQFEKMVEDVAEVLKPEEFDEFDDDELARMRASCIEWERIFTEAAERMRKVRADLPP